MVLSSVSNRKLSKTIIIVHANKSGISRYTFESYKNLPMEYLGRLRTSAAEVTFQPIPKAEIMPALMYGREEYKYTELITLDFFIL